MLTTFRVRTAAASILTTLFVVNAFAVEAVASSAVSPTPARSGESRTQARSPSQIPADSLPAVDEPQGVSIKSSVGTPDEAMVTVSRVPGASESHSKRIRLEDGQIAEVIDIDVKHDEIRAFGLSFHVTRDPAGTPLTLTLSANGDSLDLTTDSDLDSLSPRQRVAAARTNKFCAATNVYARALRVQQILQRTLLEARAGKGVRALDFWGCAFDILRIIVDWIGVVISCGLVVVPWICGMAIVWAVADTIMSVKAMPGDCGW